MTRKDVLLLVATVATFYNFAAYLFRYDGDFTVSAVVAFLALGGVFYLDHRENERRRMAALVSWSHPLDLTDWDCPEDAVYDEHLREVD
jgi:hypothetical protein